MSTHGPFEALTDQAEGFDIPESLDECLPPFAAGLALATGRALAQLAYDDAERWGDTPLDRAAAGARGSVLALMPAACDGQDAGFRRAAARAFWDLADDLAAGRAPLARCQAETWALELILQQAPKLCASTDAELGNWGVPIPDGEPGSYFGPDFEEQPYMLLIEGAEYTIAEALRAADDAETSREQSHVPDGGWTGPEYWFSPYGLTTARDDGRGHPTTEQRDQAGPTLQRAQELLRLDLDPEDHQDADEPAFGSEWQAPGFLAQVLTPQGADVLAAAADNVADRGWHHLLQLGDRVVERDEDDDGWHDDEFFLDLPPLCDGQSAAWRLAMVRAVEHLAQDLRARRAPIPTCTAEELAFHLILTEAEVVLDYLDDEDYARGMGLPPGRELSVRHRTLDRYRDYFLQDEDVLFHYDADLQHMASDPTHPASQQLGTGDLRPRAWFEPFGNVRPRPVAGLEPELRKRLDSADPKAFFASVPALTADPRPSGLASTLPMPQNLREEFENFVGLGQRRFFDVPTAIAMGKSLERLLTLLFSAPQIVPFQIWPLNPRASAVKTGLLIVDDDFCLQGLDRQWRLSADRTDRDARRWTTELLLDCANYALNHWDRGPWAILRGPDEPRPEPLDPGLPNAVVDRLRDLNQDMTVAGMLRHRLGELDLDTARLAELALLPEPLIASWLDGAEASPSQLMRCAPALQMSEDTLLSAAGGKRNTDYWPLPDPPLDRLGHPEPQGS